jgi:hypothetical protein
MEYPRYVPSPIVLARKEGRKDQIIKERIWKLEQSKNTAENLILTYLELWGPFYFFAFQLCDVFKEVASIDHPQEDSTKIFYKWDMKIKFLSMLLYCWLLTET